MRDESNYSGCRILEEWKDATYNYPSIHPAHQVIVDIVKSLNISSVCELGAGCGKISKYLYAQNPNLNITCIEHNKAHCAQIRENFEVRTGIIKPDIRVKATILQASLPELPMIKSNSYDIVFTCTVMMHLPFLVAVKSAVEIARVSKKYILHVENKNQGNEWFNMTVVKPAAMSLVNCFGIDYVKIYENLGVRTIKYFEYEDPWNPATYVVYFGEKA